MALFRKETRAGGGIKRFAPSVPRAKCHPCVFFDVILERGTCLKIHNLMEGLSRSPAAVHVLKACGLYGMPIPQGPTEPEDADIVYQELHKHR